MIHGTRESKILGGGGCFARFSYFMYFHNGGRRADLETILHGDEATKASRKRKQSVYEGFRSSVALVRRQYHQLRAITV